MSKKRYKPEEIDSILSQVDVMTSQGQSVAQAIGSIGVTEVTYTDGVRKMLVFEKQYLSLRLRSLS